MRGVSVRYRAWNPNHRVFFDRAESLSRCIPMKSHMDEGTGQRRMPVLQISWGPFLRSAPASWEHYMLFSSMPHEQYKKAHDGYERGNSVVDALLGHFAEQACELYHTGVTLPTVGVMYGVFISHEGDLPAQAKGFHLRRNFNCIPNAICPYCLANDKDVPFSDHGLHARWRATVGAQVPWTTASPMHSIPGCESEIVVSKDIFHLCHLGVLRAFCCSLLCYLISVGHFPSLVACAALVQFCFRVLHFFLFMHF